MNLLRITVACGIISLATPAIHAAGVTGAGSTFVNPVMSKWAASYFAQKGDAVNYQSVGSGAGIAQVKAGIIDFGASDKPLKPEELAASGLAQFPIVIGGVVPVVNIKGVKPGEMQFSGTLLAAIFSGKITTWNHPMIIAENPSLKKRLPDKMITTIHRADGSGTTFNWTNYLAKVSPEWKANIGEGTAIAWPSGIGGKGNEGVSAYVARLQYSIGYVEYTYAVQNKMTYAKVKNKSGNYISPSAQSFQSAAESADWSQAKDFYLVMTDAPGKDAYPITATVFIIMPKKPKDQDAANTAFAFFEWALTSGQSEAKALDYVPLPPPLVKQIKEYWKKEFKQ